MKELALVALAGALGSSLRWGAYRFVGRITPWPVWATASVNLLGCFLFGLCLSLPGGSRELRVAIGVGFLGAFTTFSAFADETLALFSAGQPWLALSNVAGQCAGGIAAVWLGAALADRALAL